jgi:hypothetical protein
MGGVLEYSGAALSNPIDVSGVVTLGSAAATTLTGPTLTTTNSGDVVVAVCNVVNQVTAVTAPFVSEGNPNNESADADYLPGATGSYTLHLQVRLMGIVFPRPHFFQLLHLRKIILDK